MSHATRRELLVASSATLAVCLVAGAATPATAAADFAGKTIEYVIPFSPGGGSDAWARFNMPFLSKYLPGKPTMVIRNVPGGGSTTGANQFAAQAKPDGLTILGTSASTQFPALLGDPRAKYDYIDFRLILAAPTGQGSRQAQGPAALLWQPGRDLARPRADRRLPRARPRREARVRHEGTQRRTAGLERGEATIDYQTTGAYLKSSIPLVKNGQAVPLFSWGATNEKGEIVRDPNFPELPHIGEAIEMATGKKPAGLEWDVLKAFVLAGFGAQKLLLLPKGTSDEIVEAYREAVRKMRKDPDYQKGRMVAIGEYEQLTDGPGEALMKQGTTIAPEARAWIRDHLTKNYNVKF